MLTREQRQVVHSSKYWPPAEGIELIEMEDDDKEEEAEEGEEG